jgi:hypothetical protein
MRRKTGNAGKDAGNDRDEHGAGLTDVLDQADRDYCIAIRQSSVGMMPVDVCGAGGRYAEARKEMRSARGRVDKQKEKSFARVSLEIAKRTDIEIGLDTATRYLKEQAPYELGSGLYVIKTASLLRCAGISSLAVHGGPLLFKIRNVA